jgi:O-antigen ligase
MAADVGMVVLLHRAGPLVAVASSLMKGYVWGACTVATIAWVLPAQPDLRLGYEELLGPNQIGYACAFGFFLAQYLMRIDHGRWGFASTLLAVTLLRSLSKTTIIAFLVGEAFFLIRDRSMSRKNKLALLLGSCVVAGIFSSLLSSYYDYYTNTGSQSEDLTGRLGIWACMVQEAVEHPWIGHGFHSVWKVVPPFGPDQFEARHAHNELLQQFYAYGAVGACLVIGIYVSFYRRIRRIANTQVKTCLFSLLLFVLVRGLADTEPFDLSLPLWAIFLFNTLLVSNKAASLQTPNDGQELMTMR